MLRGAVWAVTRSPIDEPAKLAAIVSYPSRTRAIRQAVGRRASGMRADHAHPPWPLVLPLHDIEA